jgi:hypothetical protein
VTERRKRLLAAVLLAVMVLMVVVRLSGAVRRNARADRASTAGGAEMIQDRMTRREMPANAASPGELARSCLDRGMAETRLPERDLFSPAPRGRVRPAAQLSSEEEERIRSRRKLRSLRLQATLHDGDVRLAIINGEAVREGENVSGFLLEKVEIDRVKLKRGGQTFELSMPGT